jgi:hypothetical protein
VGTTQTIVWNIAPTEPTKTLVNIYLSRDGGATYQSIAREVAAVPSEYKYIVDGSSSDKCLIMVGKSEGILPIEPTVFDVSDAVFRIVNKYATPGGETRE